MKPTAAFLSDRPDAVDRAYGPVPRARLASLVQLLPGCLGRKDLSPPAPAVAGVEVLFSTWGMPTLGEAEWAALPRLRAVFYAAGSVRPFARPLLDRGVAVFSAAAANARATAEFALAHILLAGKHGLRAQRALRRGGPGAWAPPPCPGNRGGRVALLGAGRVGRRVAELLQAFDLRVAVYDPLLPAFEVAALGAEPVGLEEAFAGSQVVSNHLADVPPTRGLVTGALLRTLPAGATFLNTGRGATVLEAELWAVLAERPDLSAVLDVTDPEPPPPGSPAYRLDNVFLSPHLAGSLGAEVGRMGDLMVDAFVRWHAGGATPLRVLAEQWDTLA